MANKKEKYDVQSIQGISIYHEDKRTVYSPFFQQKGYILSENNVHAYVSYIQGYLVALVVFVVAFIIYRRFLIPFILALLFMISTIVSFYLNFIRKANVIENYKKPERRVSGRPNGNQTRRRFGGLQPLWGMGVTSRMRVTLRPAA